MTKDNKDVLRISVGALLVMVALLMALILWGTPQADAADRHYAAIAGSYGIDSEVAAGAVLVGRQRGDVRGEMAIGFNGDRAASLSVGGGYRLLQLPDRVSLWATGATGYRMPSTGDGAPFAAAGLSLGIPIGDRYGLSIGYSYSHNWERGTGGGAIGLRFTVSMGGP